MSKNVQFQTLIFLVILVSATICIFVSMWSVKLAPLGAMGLLIGSSIASTSGANSSVDLKWYAPKKTFVNDLRTVINGTGVYGFIFNSSETPAYLPRDTYNWCNMPRVDERGYVKAGEEYRLRYVEVIHRHHKRTPYASNTFPKETYSWSCDDQALFYYGLTKTSDDTGALINWQVYTSSSNPLAPSGFNGTCQFPQITSQGLVDSRKHGSDLAAVYAKKLKFLPKHLDLDRVKFRVTNNQITSQVAGQAVYGMYPEEDHVPIATLVQPSSVDSLEPSYSCPAASSLYSSYGVGSNNSEWLRHLSQSQRLFSKLDSVSGISASNTDWHKSFDHYFDNLSARLCHQKPLPCNATRPDLCVTMTDAEDVFRRGLYEYSYIYRDSPLSLQASVASYGIWMAELADNLRNVIAGKDETIWRYNIAHDGSISRLLSILQVDVMVWPGMGSEVVFELYEKHNSWFLRVLWNGQALSSSNPSLGRIEMLPVDTFLSYVDGLVGAGASKVPGLCKG